MFMYLHSMTTHLSALIAPLNTNNSLSLQKECDAVA